MGGRRLRALALGEHTGVREFINADSALRLAEARRDARADAESLARMGARIVTLRDDAYPAGLRDLPTAPAFLCVRGELPAGGVAIVGSRAASEAACAFAFALAVGLGRPLVSGLALGIDAAAHRGALAAGLPQVAYVGSGLGQTYPPEHADLAEAIVTGGGALASERLPSDPVSRRSLVARDRLQAAHAQAVVLVESEADGGAMHTVRFARELGRPCFACDVAAGGNRLALAAGARPLAADVGRALSALLTSFPSQEPA